MKQYQTFMLSLISLYKYFYLSHLHMYNEYICDVDHKTKNHCNIKYNRTNVYLWVILAAVSCDEPENLTNGDRMGHDFTFMKTVHYLCHPGYRLNGSSTRTCTASGTWTGSSPSCVQHYFYGNCLYYNKYPCVSLILSREVLF